MSTKIAIAVLHCALGQWKKIIQRANKVKDNLYVNVLLYATPKVAEADFTSQLGKASTAEAAALKGGVEETARYYKETTLLFEYLGELVIYVNGLYRGNKVNLLASGFDVVDEMVPLDLPEPPVVNRMVTGPVPHSVKFYIQNLPGTVGKAKPHLTYIVAMTTDPSKDENFIPELITSSKYKLLITGLTRGKEVFFRLAVKNTRGQSNWTETFSIIPQ
jgi:hypothetical protein